MATSNLFQLYSNQYILLLLIIFWTIYSSSLVDCAVSEAESFHVVSVQSLIPKEECSSFGEKDPSKLKIINQHGPCSPLTHNPKPTHQTILQADRVRAHYLNTKTSIPTSQIPAKKGTYLSTGNYIIQVSLGTPKISQSVVFDTGSDTTWVQCQPCLGQCYDQQDQIFDPSQSSTYSNVSCTSPSCTSLYPHGCSGSTCLYQVRYGDNSFTVGFYAQDTFTLSPTDVIPNFQFGCGERNNGLFGRTAGLLGLGRRPSSIVVQTMDRYGGAFAYCLPALSSSAGYLTFGRHNAAGSDVLYTPMLSRENRATFYYLDLTSMSVGGEALDVSSTVFSGAGVIIDSGTVITRMPPSAYAKLRSAFASGMSKYPSAEGAEILDLCYDLSGYDTVSIPTVGMSFRGATVNLDPAGILYVISAEQVCLGFAPNGADGDLMIVGNTQQRRFNVVYDVARKVVGFGAGAC